MASEVAQKILAEVEELLLGQSLAAQPELNDGSGGSAVGDDQRRRGARRQAAHGGLRDGRDLRDRRLDVGAGAEEDLDDSQTVYRLRFRCSISLTVVVMPRSELDTMRSAMSCGDIPV